MSTQPNTLLPNQYHFIVLANGQEILNKPFEVLNEDHVFTITNYHLPKPQMEGRTFPVTGIIKADKPMTCVSVGVYDEQNTWVTGASAAPNAQSFDLSALDAQVRFDWLCRDKTYHYVIEAENCEGQSETLVNQPFYVY